MSNSNFEKSQRVRKCAPSYAVALPQRSICIRIRLRIEELCAKSSLVIQRWRWAGLSSLALGQHESLLPRIVASASAISPGGHYKAFQIPADSAHLPADTIGSRTTSFRLSTKLQPDRCEAQLHKPRHKNSQTRTRRAAPALVQRPANFFFAVHLKRGGEFTRFFSSPRLCERIVRTSRERRICGLRPF